MTFGDFFLLFLVPKKTKKSFTFRENPTKVATKIADNFY